MKVHVMRRARRAYVGVVTLTGVVCASVGAGTARAQSLEQLPPDTLFLIRVSNLGKVSDKTAALAKRLGLDQMSPDAGDPLAALQNKAGIKEGLDKNSDLAIAFFDGPVTGSKEELGMVMLIPVTDFKTFVGNFTDAHDEEGVTAFTTNDGTPGFAKPLGKYAAMSPEKSVLAWLKPGGVPVPGEVARKELAEKDLVVYANFAALRTKYLPEIEKNRQSWLAELEKDVLSTPRKAPAMGGADDQGEVAAEKAQADQLAKKKKFLPVIKAAANQGINVLEAMLKDGTSATYGVSLTDAGVNGTLALEFKPGSYAANLLGMFQGSNDTFLAGLPESKYLVFGGASYDPKPIVKAIDDFSAPVVKELNGIDDPDAKTILTFVDTAKRAIGATTGQTFGALAPTGPLQQEALVQGINLYRGDSKTLLAAQEDVLKGQEEIMALATGGAAGSKTIFTPNARQIDGVTFNEFKTEMTGEASTPEAMQAQQALSFLYGPEGMSGLSAAIDDKTVLAVSGLPAAQLSNAIKAAKSGDDVLGKSQTLKLTVDQLPRKRVAAVYIPLDVILGTGINYAKQFGMPINVQMAENLPPIGITYGAVGSAFRADGHLPTPLIQSVTSAVMQVYMGMMGGGGGAQPQGGGL
jgi:hypothetical protein